METIFSLQQQLNNMKAINKEYWNEVTNRMVAEIDICDVYYHCKRLANGEMQIYVQVPRKSSDDVIIDMHKKLKAWCESHPHFSNFSYYNNSIRRSKLDFNVMLNAVGGIHTGRYFNMNFNDPQYK